MGMNMGTKLGTVAAILLLLLASRFAEADTGSPAIEVKKIYKQGTSKLGANTVLSGRLEQSASRSGVDGNVQLQARLFGKTYNAFRFHALSEVKGGTTTNGIYLYAGPFKVWSKAKVSGWAWTPSINQVYLEKNRSFFLGGFYLNGGARVGGSVYGSLKLAANITGAGVEGKVGSTLWSDVTVGLDLFLYRAGLQAKAKISNGWWQADATLGFWGLDAEFGYHFKPLQIDLNFVIQKAKLKWKGWKLRRTWKKWKSLTLISFHSPEWKIVYMEVSGKPLFSIQKNLARLIGGLDSRITTYVDTDEKVVALTFDDGPNTTSTAKILSTLAKHDVPATFFLVGSRVVGKESLVSDIHLAGHEIGNHTYDGQPSILVPGAKLKEGMEKTHDLLSPIAPVKWFRPAAGYCTPGILNSAEELGYQTILGDVFPYDPWIKDSSFHSKYILTHVRPGSIIVLHDLAGNGKITSKTLDLIIPALKARGYQFRTISELKGQE